MSRLRVHRPGLVAAALAACFLTPSLASADNFAVSFDAGVRTMSNSPDTEKAIFDKERGKGFGLGGTYEPGSRWRFGIEVRRIDRDGERAFAADRTSPAFRLGHPLNFKLTESLASIAFKFRKIGPVAPYLAVGGGMVSWREQSNIAGLIEEANGSTGLFEARLGVERQQGHLRYGFEGGITLIPNSIGVGGISKVYEESDLGGLFVVAKIAFSRK